MNTVAEIVAIGDELLYGQTLDTNSHWISGALDAAGIKVVRRTTVGDVEAEILDAFAAAEKRADVILITGGLGPTNDDLTKPCLAKYFDCEMQVHPEALAEVTEFFKSRGRALTELNRLQASLPVCCEKITNRLGTAPGMWFSRGGRVFVSMPGVPHEMKAMMEESVIPKLRKNFKTPPIHHTIIRTVGIGESFLAEKIAAWENALPPAIKLAYLPGYGEVKLRLTAIGSDAAGTSLQVDEQVASLRELIGEYIYGTGEITLEEAVGDLLRMRAITLSVAESCTGGYLSHLITSIPGSSAYFKGGMVAYHNDVKASVLDVDHHALSQDGAVSESVVREMAEKVRLKFRTDIGVATSGIAGPSGGTPEKPVGTVWIALADGRQTVARKLQLSKDRAINIRLSATSVLNLIRRTLAEEKS